MYFKIMSPYTIMYFLFGKLFESCWQQATRFVFLCLLSSVTQVGQETVSNQTWNFWCFHLPTSSLPKIYHSKNGSLLENNLLFFTCNA